MQDGLKNSALFERAVARAKEIYVNRALEATEARGDVGPKSLDEILPEHVDRQEEILYETKDTLLSWGIDFNKLKLALALTDIAKASTDVTFNALLAFKDRELQDLPDTAVKLAMKPVGIDLVEVIQHFDRILRNQAGESPGVVVLRRLKGLANVLLHAEAGRLMVAETLEILGQTKEDLTGESGPDSPTRREAFRLGAEVADQITGHDSFRAGFGRDVLPHALGAMLNQLYELVTQLPLEDRIPADESTLLLKRVKQVSIDLRDPGVYPPSQNMEGFILQILDRLEALDPKTHLRYVKESMAYQGKTLEAAISGGIHANLSGLKEILRQLHVDIDESSMSDTDKARVRGSPYMTRFELGLRQFEQVLPIFRRPANENLPYSLEVDDNVVVIINTFEQLEKWYPDAYGRKARLVSGSQSTSCNSA